jgi:hypothetical protein
VYTRYSWNTAKVGSKDQTIYLEGMLSIYILVYHLFTMMENNINNIYCITIQLNLLFNIVFPITFFC